MKECTETTAGWPNEPNDVSPDAMDAFLAHVDGCPFHAKVLSLETEKLRARYRFAQGLDSDGRILVGRELRQALAEHDQQNDMWRESAPRMELPFKRIYLTNHGEDIAGSGRFFDFRRYEGEHRLDPEAGLQIWGVIGEGGSVVKVLLGFYPLRGVRHTGQEQFLPLENGYTVGLRVEQLSGRIFNIGFRCVENEILEQESLEAPRPKAAVKKPGLADDAWRWATEKLERLGGILTPSPALSSRQRIENGALPLIAGVMVFLVSLPILLGSAWVQGNSDNHPSGRAHWNKDDSGPANVQDEKPTLKIIDSSIQLPATTNENTKRSATTGDRKIPQGNNSDSVNNKPDKEKPKPDLAKKVESTRKETSWYFQSVPHKSAAPENVTVHSGVDQILEAKLTAEMRKRNLNIERLKAVPFNGKHVAIAWTIIRENSAVTVKATLTADGNSQELSFRSDGTCPEQTCEAAVRTAVSGVFAVMRDLTHG